MDSIVAAVGSVEARRETVRSQPDFTEDPPAAQRAGPGRAARNGELAPRGAAGGRWRGRRSQPRRRQKHLHAPALSPKLCSPACVVVDAKAAPGQLLAGSAASRGCCCCRRPGTLARRQSRVAPAPNQGTRPCSGCPWPKGLGRGRERRRPSRPRSRTNGGFQGDCSLGRHHPRRWQARVPRGFFHRGRKCRTGALGGAPRGRSSERPRLQRSRLQHALCCRGAMAAPDRPPRGKATLLRDFQQNPSASCVSRVLCRGVPGKTRRRPVCEQQRWECAPPGSSSRPPPHSRSASPFAPVLCSQLLAMKMIHPISYRLVSSAAFERCIVLTRVSLWGREPRRRANCCPSSAPVGRQHLVGSRL